MEASLGDHDLYSLAWQHSQRFEVQLLEDTGAPLIIGKAVTNHFVDALLI